MDAYKDKRYSGWRGKCGWVKDKFAGLPEEANQIFVQARAGYVTAMQGGHLQRRGPHRRRTEPRRKRGSRRAAPTCKAEVDKLPKDLQQLGKQAAAEFAGKFDELTQSVDDKGTELVRHPRVEVHRGAEGGR